MHLKIFGHRLLSRNKSPCKIKTQESLLGSALRYLRLTRLLRRRLRPKIVVLPFIFFYLARQRRPWFSSSTKSEAVQSLIEVMVALLAPLRHPIEVEEVEIPLAATHPQALIAHLLQPLILVVVTVAAEQETAEMEAMSEAAEDTIGIVTRRRFKDDQVFRIPCELSRIVKHYDTSLSSIIFRNNTLYTPHHTIEISTRYWHRPYHVIDRIFLSQQHHFHITYTL
jgi:hypothetical protein